MQNRMKTHQLQEAEIKALMDKCPVGVLATVNTDGTPYCVPVHFARHKDAVVVHGLPAGQKIENIKANPSVCLSAYEMQGLILPEGKNPCSTNTAYMSVIIKGKASLLEDFAEKKAALMSIVTKYTPQLAENEMPERAVKATAVIKIEIEELTGKYYS